MPTANVVDVRPQNGPPATNGYDHDSGKNDENGPSQAQSMNGSRMSAQKAVGAYDKDLPSLSSELSELYSPTVEAKIWAVASKALTMVSGC